MIKTSLIEILRSFSSEEIQRFKDFVSSPYHNKIKNLEKLFLIIKNYSPGFSDPGLEKEKVWRKLFQDKKYNYGIPYTDSVQSIDSVYNSVKNTYLNIPMNITYSGMISENIGMSFSGGPYFGILLNPDNAVNGFKDFDFGLNGILTGRYYLNQFVSVLLGGNVQYGGLNNLLSANSVSSLQTVNWGAFTGLGVGF